MVAKLESVARQEAKALHFRIGENKVGRIPKEGIPLFPRVPIEVSPRSRRNVSREVQKRWITSHLEEGAYLHDPSFSLILRGASRNSE